ncbi:hypothetical protein PFICI_12295 [Pestalotiopsis fici W106-1]|uniref:Nephrocystin 3-like N-terminal domain-containing protein n=1 Tax=Pestalotiopsis fici (strain W106-1 / CGMCC3.15140) TaxID=1229662 RepID=W3WRA5_PESFW|nr:uncharacterized protein PFICI_12295 [Pestalotiopsis fici W106-1]ETS75351.1 hypothetical protein PFICI_12295 [Pestalotiopsis fici W106-1]
MAPHLTSLVYRLRGLPSYISSHTQAAGLLGWALGQQVASIEICSLATVTVSAWTGTTKTATVMFEEIPQIVQDSPNQDEWTILHPRLVHGLLLDSHFRGMTPLHDVLPPREHKYSCIAISGLSSHPFGSWQPQGGRKEFIWLRDELPQHHPTMRVWVYGYDTNLTDRTSFQSISDLSISLINHLEASDFASPTAPQMLVMAHSLGGIVFKEAISNLARGGEKYTHILHLIRGAILFGVPNLGMEQSHLQNLVQHQPNRSLVKDLALNSPYLLDLDKRFLAHKFNHRMNVIWAYETRTSGVFEVTQDGKICKSANRRILVSKESATSNLISEHANLTIPINKDHSSIVKYHRNDEDCSRVMLKIREIIDGIVASPSGRPGAFDISGPPVAEQQAQPSTVTPSSGPSMSFTFMDIRQDEKIVSSVTAAILVSVLHVPELSERHEAIEARAMHTFEWIFENDELEFTKWLRSGDKLYWIQGKPGSGKSTLMKFIYNDPRTRALLDNWKNSERPIVASFFFHHRGSVLQKSIDGLLRSILAQILRQQPRLADIFNSAIEELVSVSFPLKEQALKTKLQSHAWKQSELWKMLCQILGQKLVKLDICFFFDALDEYDGTPDVIKEFLSDLNQASSSGLTNLKICFSSRSWESFKISFSKHTNFSIHEHTTNDIQAYCYQTLESLEAVAELLGPLVPEITETASGVFLWARLALRDLIQEVEENETTANPESLREKLNRLPKELKDYYGEIVKRCHHSLRMQAYMLLEIVTRSDGILTLSQVSLILASFTSKTVNACRNAIELSRTNEGIEGSEFAHTEKMITNACGGLVEVKGLSYVPQRMWYIQLMHQTVREFVLGPKFKTLFLDSGAKYQHENGHSFLGKFYLTQSMMGVTSTVGMRFSESISPVELARYHLKEAEMTTGKSQLQFINSFTRDQIDATSYTGGRTGWTGWTGPRVTNLPFAQFDFAATGGLHLCLTELIIQYFVTNEEKDAALLRFLSLLGVGDHSHRTNSKDSQSILQLLGLEEGDTPLKFLCNNRVNLISQQPVVRLPPYPEAEGAKIGISSQYPIEGLPFPDPQGTIKKPVKIIEIHDDLLTVFEKLFEEERDAGSDLIALLRSGIMICNPWFTDLVLVSQFFASTDVMIWGRMFVEWSIVFWSTKERAEDTGRISVALAESIINIFNWISSDQKLLINNRAAWKLARRNLLGPNRNSSLYLEVVQKMDVLLSRDNNSPFVNSENSNIQWNRDDRFEHSTRREPEVREPEVREPEVREPERVDEHHPVQEPSRGKKVPKNETISAFKNTLKTRIKGAFTSSRGG